MMDVRSVAAQLGPEVRLHSPTRACATLSHRHSPAAAFIGQSSRAAVAGMQNDRGYSESNGRVGKLAEEGGRGRGA